MSEGVVDELEAVEVDEEYRQVRSRLLRVGDGISQTPLERGPVEKAGEGVVLCLGEGLAVDAELAAYSGFHND